MLVRPLLQVSMLSIVVPTAQQNRARKGVSVGSALGYSRVGTYIFPFNEILHDTTCGIREVRVAPYNRLDHELLI